MLFSKHISATIGQRLYSVIEQFYGLLGLPKMCGAIEGIHIKLWKKPTPWYIPTNY
jgi:hypothetical protein